MTTEEAFQKALDANPADATLRLIFADFLDEQYDPRGPGYRALGVNGVIPCPYTNGLESRQWEGANEFTLWKTWTGLIITKGEFVPKDWFDLIPKLGAPLDNGRHYRSRRFRRELEDAAALAFAKLPPARQAELLGQVEAVA